jgi:hypothetical protein
MAEGVKRRKSAEAICRDFVRAVSWEIVRAATVSHEETVGRLRNLGKFYVKQLEGHPKLALEMRRRIAEQLLEQAIFRRSSLSVCRARLNAASRLGFADVERKAHCHMLYALGASARGNKRVAKKIAAEIANDLEQSLKKREGLLARDCLAHARRFLKFINSESNVMNRTSEHA